jgi:Predicted transcriptional regulators
MSDISKLIGRRIRNYRTQSGFTQEKLAELSGFHPTYIGQVERGEKNTTLESIHKISAALKISLEQLFQKLDIDMNSDTNSDANIPLLCYNLIAAKNKQEQEMLYNVLLEIDKI